jgi:circadian clock protein KaiC
MSDARMRSGVPGFDEIVNGGLRENYSYLIVGSAGTGKTILSLQWLLEGARAGEKCLFITLAEPAGKIEQNVSGFGWSLDGIELVDLTQTGESAPEVEGEYQVFPPSEVEQTPLWSRIYQAIAEKSPQRVVIDSLTQLQYLSTDEFQFRKRLLGLVNFLNQHGATTFLVFEPTQLEKEASVALAVDGIVRLKMQTSPNRVIGLRSLQIEKLRGSDFLSGLHPLRITGEGIVIFPHRIEKTGRTSPGEYLLSPGNAELDELLGGGIESGTTTLITGPAGVGKSTLGMKFLVEAAGQNRRGVYYSFEESVDSVVKRCRGINLDVSGLIEQNLIKIVRVNAMELYPDEFLQMVREETEKDQPGVFVIDSMRGYNLAMEEFGTPVAHLHNLAVYLSGRGATTILLNEVENITGELKATEIGISHLADNIILLRYAEHASRVVKIVACLKKRLGNFQPELRELTITPEGIKVSEKLEGLTGILTGVPTYDVSN